MAEQFDIVVSGGGIAGMAATAGFAALGFSVACIDPAPPITDETAAGADMRSTALMQPSVELLRRVGLWPRLAAHAAPLQVMRIIEADEAGARMQRDFDAADLSDAPFGWNLPNWLIRREMEAHLSGLAGVSFRPGIATHAVFTREGEAQVTLSDGARLRARLLIAADGRGSPVRRALGIGVRTTHYGQKALAFSVTHPLPHGNISTEIHRSGGPFTLVPLPDREGVPASAIVWMERGPEAERLAALPVAVFEAALLERSCGILGPLKLVTGRALWPMISQIAERFQGQRSALMAEAAHVVPPIGAQGLNMSLADLTCLLNLAERDRFALGSAPMLAAYQRRRWPEVAARVAGIDALNRASMLGARPLREARAGALAAMFALAPVRRGLMRAGLGARQT
ncbi:MAG: 2-octaprenyl-6-methoxyphenyl hydroxylase [Alphaproteobacteria bacterium HGW-Alphaproteobacteria-4]|nr:MAG: 2-octaprenyl-6-methoxyphenyl hydroxylase [Alphaproteobacteria bacterium HGW-Alphaproteobacteria-4]